MEQSIINKQHKHQIGPHTNRNYKNHFGRGEASTHEKKPIRLIIFFYGHPIKQQKQETKPKF